MLASSDQQWLAEIIDSTQFNISHFRWFISTLETAKNGYEKDYLANPLHDILASRMISASSYSRYPRFKDALNKIIAGEASSTEQRAVPARQTQRQKQSPRFNPHRISATIRPLHIPKNQLWHQKPVEALLIEDLPAIRQLWEHSAKRNNIHLKTFVSAENFYASNPEFSYSKHITIYTDVNLGAGNMRGDQLAKELQRRGFTNITLATSYSPAQFADMTFLQSVQGKQPPFSDPVVAARIMHNATAKIPWLNPAKAPSRVKIYKPTLNKLLIRRARNRRLYLRGIR